jgi:hypothetical protein
MTSISQQDRATILPRLLGGIGVASGLAFATLFPTDRLFAGGSLLRSVSLYILGTGIGMVLAPKVGLSTGVKPSLPRAYIGAIVVSAFCVAAYVALIDALLFRSILPADYAGSFLTDPLAERLPAYCARAFYESLMYRLFVGTLLTWGLSRAAGYPGRAPFRLVFLAMLLAQIINIVANIVIPLWPVASPMLIFWIAVRFVIPGTFWGCLYYRNGLVVSEYAAAATHVFLQPAMSLAMAATI